MLIRSLWRNKLRQRRAAHRLLGAQTWLSPVFACFAGNARPRSGE